MMGVESDSDRSVFFDTDEFGVAATYTPDGGSPATVNGIFDDGFELIEGDHAGLESTAPMFTCKTSDVPAVAHGDTLVINSVTYSIVGVRPDGTGVTQLDLEQQ